LRDLARAKSFMVLSLSSVCSNNITVILGLIDREIFYIYRIASDVLTRASSYLGSYHYL
jgi:hypothetical protein